MKNLFLTKLTSSDKEIVYSKEVLYEKAMLLFTKEQYEQAYPIYMHLNDYKKSKGLAYLCLNDEITTIKQASTYDNVKVNDIIKFGSYIQESDQKEPIEWIVLDKQEDKMLVISKKILDCRRYHNKNENINWEYCDIRTWLNKYFLNTAFTKEEQTKIIESKIINGKNPLFETHCGNDTLDRVFLLSIQEAEKYFKDDEARSAKGSNYAIKHGLLKLSNGNSWYWLRSSGSDSNNAAIVYSDGYVDMTGDNVDNDDNGIRPALWINLKS